MKATVRLIPSRLPASKLLACLARARRAKLLPIQPPPARSRRRRQQIRNRNNSEKGSFMVKQPGSYAVFETSLGKITCRLFEAEAPATVKNFVDLAEGTQEWTNPKTGKRAKEKLYNGTIFHRVIPDFM